GVRKMHGAIYTILHGAGVHLAGRHIGLPIGVHPNATLGAELDVGAIGQVSDGLTAVQMVHNPLLTGPNGEPSGGRIVLKKFAGAKHELFVLAQTHARFLGRGIRRILAKVAPQSAVSGALKVVFVDWRYGFVADLSAFGRGAV